MDVSNATENVGRNGEANCDTDDGDDDDRIDDDDVVEVGNEYEFDSTFPLVSSDDTVPDFPDVVVFAELVTDTSVDRFASIRPSDLTSNVSLPLIPKIGGNVIKLVDHIDFDSRGHPRTAVLVLSIVGVTSRVVLVPITSKYDNVLKLETPVDFDASGNKKYPPTENPLVAAEYDTFALTIPCSVNMNGGHAIDVVGTYRDDNDEPDDAAAVDDDDDNGKGHGDDDDGDDDDVDGDSDDDDDDDDGNGIDNGDGPAGDDSDNVMVETVEVGDEFGATFILVSS